MFGLSSVFMPVASIAKYQPVPAILAGLMGRPECSTGTSRCGVWRVAPETQRGVGVALSCLKTMEASCLEIEMVGGRHRQMQAGRMTHLFQNRCKNKTNLQISRHIRLRHVDVTSKKVGVDAWWGLKYQKIPSSHQKDRRLRQSCACAINQAHQHMHHQPNP